MTVDERIREKCRQFRISYRELATRTGIPQSSMQRYCTGTKPIPLDRLEMIAKCLYTTSPQLMGYEPDIPEKMISVSRKSVPLLGKIAAGNPILANEDFETYIDADSDIRCDYALIVDGDSMEPNIKRGDLVFIRKQSDVNDGQIAAVLIDDSATLKRVFHIPNGLTLVSDNAAKFPPRTVTMPEYDSILILGLAVALKRRI